MGSVMVSKAVRVAGIFSAPKVPIKEVKEHLEKIDMVDHFGDKAKTNLVDLCRATRGDTVTFSFVFFDGLVLTEEGLRRELKQLGVRVATFHEGLSLRKMTAENIEAVISATNHERRAISAGAPHARGDLLMVPLGSVLAARGQDRTCLVNFRKDLSGSWSPTAHLRTDNPLPALWMFPVVKLN